MGSDKRPGLLPSSISLSLTTGHPSRACSFPGISGQVGAHLLRSISRERSEFPAAVPLFSPMGKSNNNFAEVQFINVSLLWVMLLGSSVTSNSLPGPRS